MTIVFRTKKCSWCHQISWDSEDGSYDNECRHPDRDGKKCDTNGEEAKYDEDGYRVW